MTYESQDTTGNRSCFPSSFSFVLMLLFALFRAVHSSHEPFPTTLSGHSLTSCSSMSFRFLHHYHSTPELCRLATALPSINTKVNKKRVVKSFTQDPENSEFPAPTQRHRPKTLAQSST